MKTTIMVLLLGLWSMTAAGFEVSQYTFTWNIAAAGRAALDIEKTPEGSYVILKATQRVTGGRLKLTPSEAEALAQVFLRVDEFHQQMRDKRSDSAKVMAEQYEVTFSISSSGFWVTITPPNSLMGLGSIALDREGIKVVTPAMLEASQRVKYFEERILF
ncbi:hypothetical protein [Thioflexithrix psekupsensis]|uniref:Lipocalin-like domain-containing protein n=1 Tax=Thioflexithrix psekupsensis TaxID=1570016 RepID=A0A251XC46_9GAMM|nr:hypothetical protein [Thioflexithrix psekupsensis]OUD16199.1 hypothetical protein TPSD3_00280 [Thioflexithrix psekupsensis]